MIRHLPNALTLLNLLCGCLTILSLLHFNIEYAFYFHLASLVFDFFDGLVARALKVNSPLGIQLDSLSDVVSFGVAPSCAVLILLTQNLQIDLSVVSFGMLWPLIPAFLLALCGAYRLGRFNLSTDQNVNFIGLPTPAMAIYFMSLLLLPYSEIPFFVKLVNDPKFLYLSIIVFAYLMNSSLIFYKIKPTREVLTNPLIIILAGSIIALLIFYPTLLPFCTILIYCLISGIGRIMKNEKNGPI